MKNRMQDLNDHLFAQLERLGDEDMTPDQIEAEAKRAEAMVRVSDQIIATADLRLRGAKLYAEFGDRVLHMLPQIGGPGPSDD